MKRKFYLMLLAGALSCSLLLSACGSDTADTSADTESSAAAAEADEEDDEDTVEEASNDSDGDTDADSDTDEEADENTDAGDDSSGSSEQTTISDKKLKKQVTALIEDVSENQASQSLSSAGYEPTVSSYEGALMVYLRMPDPVDMPLYAEAICDYIAEAEEKYDNFSIDAIYLRTYEEADEGYVEDGTLISWVTTNGEDGMFIDEVNNVTLSDFSIDHLKAYFGTE